MIKRIRICQSVVVSLSGIILLFATSAQASGDRRVVQPPQLSQPVCTTLSPEAHQSSTSVQHRLQQALNQCPAGQAVRLTSGPQGNTFKSGPLQIPSGVFLRLDAGSVLLADNDPRRYDTGQGHCGTIDQKGGGCRAFISMVNSVGGGIEGEGTIDGQGGERIVGQNETWWEMARRAQSVTGGRQNAPRLIQIDDAHDIVIYGVRLRHAPNFHIVLNHVQGATLWGVIIDTPATARNTDGIDPGASQDVTITHSFIRTGDDNIAIKAGSGPSRHLSITDNHFYSGHGMSIGSEVNAGVSDVLVRNLTLDGTTSGLRIKSDASRGGLVSDILYSRICMRNTRWPVSFDTHYSPTASGTSLPEYRNIILRDVNASGDRPATVILRGYDASHPLMVRMDGVTFSPGTQWITEFVRLTSGTNGIQPSPPATINPVAAHYSPIDCSEQWVPFPA